MKPLEIDINFEASKEYRLLEHAVGGQVPLATYLYIRLWVDLGFEARSSKVGYLTPAGVTLLEARLLKEVGRPPAADRWVDVFEAATLLVRHDDMWHCPSFCFQGLNAAQSGSFTKKELVGANHSAHARRKKSVAKESEQVGFVLLGHEYVSAKNVKLNASELAGAVNVIRTLDNCLQLKSRNFSTVDYPPSLVTMAYEVSVAYQEQQLEMVYLWIIDNRGAPDLPGTTEQVLAHFDYIFQTASKDG